MSLHEDILTVIKSAIKASSTKAKKDKKKNKKAELKDVPDEEAVPKDEPQIDPSISKNPVEVTAEDLVDEEWGPVKGKKDKKGKAKKGKATQDDEEDDMNKPEGMLVECAQK